MAPLTELSEQNLAALRRAMARSERFALFFVLADGPARAEVRARIGAWSGMEHVPSLRFFPEGVTGETELLERLRGTGPPLAGAVIVDGDTLVANRTAITAMNIARDVLGRVVEGPLVMILAPARQVELMHLAPDLFAVRSGTYEIEVAPALEEPPPEEHVPRAEVAAKGRSARPMLPDREVLRALEASPERPPPAALSDQWLRLAAALEESAAWEDAADAARNAARIAQDIKYFGGVVPALRVLSRVHLRLGDLAAAEDTAREALRLAEEHLDHRAQAAAVDEVAAALSASRKLDLALAIRREQQLPLLATDRDARLRAGAVEKIAGLLQALGDGDQALRLLRQVREVLENQGDHRARADVERKIADLLEARGEMDEGVRTRLSIDEPWSPFPGLSFFDDERETYFFGRAAELRAVLDRLAERRPPARWLQVEGLSGVGKSSFARAGLLPAIRAGKLAGGPDRRVVTVVFRPGPDPIASLSEALVKHARPPLDFSSTPRAAEREGPAALVDFLTAELRASPAAFPDLLRAALPPGHGLVLVIDPLEEVFTLARAGGAAAQALDGLLAAALDARELPFLLVSTIRSDFLARMGELQALERKLAEDAVRYHLGPMSEAGLREAIEEPARRAGLRYEAGLVERILSDARDTHGPLPLVAHMLRALYAMREGGTLTAKAYTQLGGLGGGITKSADAVLEDLDAADGERARRMLLRLVKTGHGGEDARQPAPRKDVLQAAGGLRSEAERVLAHLSGARSHEETGAEGFRARLVVVSGRAGHERVDLVHEALIHRWDKLRKWIEQHRAALELRDDVEDAERIWEASGCPEKGLPKGALLARFQGVDPALLRGGARSYLRDAVEAHERAERRSWWLSVVVGFVMLGGVVVVFAKYDEGHNRRQDNKKCASQVRMHLKVLRDDREQRFSPPPLEVLSKHPCNRVSEEGGKELREPLREWTRSWPLLEPSGGKAVWSTDGSTLLVTSRNFRRGPRWRLWGTHNWDSFDTWHGDIEVDLLDSNVVISTDPWHQDRFVAVGSGGVAWFGKDPAGAGAWPSFHSVAAFSSRREARPWHLEVVTPDAVALLRDGRVVTSGSVEIVNNEPSYDMTPRNSPPVRRAFVGVISAGPSGPVVAEWRSPETVPDAPASCVSPGGNVAFVGAAGVDLVHMNGADFAARRIADREDAKACAWLDDRILALGSSTGDVEIGEVDGEDFAHLSFLPVDPPLEGPVRAIAARPTYLAAADATTVLLARIDRLPAAPLRPVEVARWTHQEPIQALDPDPLGRAVAVSAGDRVHILEIPLPEDGDPVAAYRKRWSPPPASPRAKKP